MWILSKLRLAPKVISISEKHSWTSQIESYQISDSLAHLCLKQFQRIPENIKIRQSIANTYEQELKSTPEVKTFDMSEQQVSLFYPILVADPYRLQTVVKRFNVILNLDWTGSPVSPNMKSFKKYEYDLSKTPVAQAQAKQLVLLPLHQNMTQKKAIKVTSLIKKYYESHR
jgi:dTDP-4-amino-4,6-dideoxygalactose transaminase